MSRYAINIFKNYCSGAGYKAHKNKIQIGFFLRNMSGQTGVATFKDVKEAKNNPNVIVIDVREPSELKETGVIPGSINIPLNQLVNVFKSTNQEQFEKSFGRPKPSFDFPIIFTCKSGNRSRQAAEQIRGLGYKNVRDFKGGWLEWEAKQRK